jgi:hypothetical protein
MKAAISAFMAMMAIPLMAQQAQQSASVMQPSPVVVPQTPTPAATMNQIISRLNARQYQINAAAAQNAAQRPVFIPQRVIIKPAK